MNNMGISFYEGHTKDLDLLPFNTESMLIQKYNILMLNMSINSCKLLL